MTTLQSMELVLRCAGHPLTRSELRAALGLPADHTACFYALHGRPPFVEIDDRRLGLIDRDLPGSTGALQQALEAIAHTGCRAPDVAHAVVTSLGEELASWSKEMAASAYRIFKARECVPESRVARGRQSKLARRDVLASRLCAPVLAPGCQKVWPLRASLSVRAARRVSLSTQPGVSARTGEITPSELATVSIRGSPPVYLVCLSPESFRAPLAPGVRALEGCCVRSFELVRSRGLGSEKS
jgi:hypothetical protein